MYGSDAALESSAASGEYPSGQRTAPVKRQAQPSQVRILPPPFRPRGPGTRPLQNVRGLGRPGQTTIARRRQITLPHVPFTEAGLKLGDRLRFRADGPGRLVVERIDPPSETAPPRQTELASLVRNRH